ncbi:hypothetical protein [Streptomyces ambofaciens]|uniref:hypothetical protein n=1 Tax=Streptomyces ambofaciens TaxID=1889 RepID=UPI0007B50628|nr:hypothetical protein [Streptomyces ambofaciens]
MRTLVSTSPVARSPRRLRLTLAVAALTTLALTACGTEKTDADGPQSKHVDTAGARPNAAFTEMLGQVAQSCPPSAAPEAPPTGPAETLSPGSVETPPSEAIELNARDWCAGVRHEQRIAQELWDLADPTPTKVRAILNDLGYIDERIHDLEQSGTTTRFFVDLRDRGGRLCLDGSAAGEETVVEMCVAPASGPFTPEKR